VLPLNQSKCPNCGAKVEEINLIVTTPPASELDIVYEKNQNIRPLLNVAEYWACSDSPALASVKYEEAAEALLSSSNYKDAAKCFRFATKYAPTPHSRLFYETKTVECELMSSSFGSVAAATRENVEALLEHGDVGIAEKQAFLYIMKAVSESDPVTALQELDSIPHIATLSQDKNDPLYCLRSLLVALGKHHLREAEEAFEEVRRLLTWRHDLQEEFVFEALNKLQATSAAN
jgi:hypothetical protein